MTQDKRDRLVKLCAKLEAKLAAGKGGLKRAFIKGKVATIKARLAGNE